MIVDRAGSGVRLLQCVAEFFPALEEAIDAARADVYLETYIYADDASGRLLSAALVRAAARGVGHYGKAGYGGCRTFASVLGEDEAEELLQETLDEEGAADEKLTEIAEGTVNEDAEDEEKMKPAAKKKTASRRR